MRPTSNEFTPTCGVIFTATGDDKYARLAERAAESIREHNPDLPIDLYSDKPRESTVFDKVHVLDNPWVRSRIDAMRMSRFERTLMLDSDIIVLGDLSELFDILERFDIAAAHDQWRNGPEKQTIWRRRLPSAFAEFNGGVIAFRKTDSTDNFFKDWAAAVRDHAIGRDQASFRELLWESDLRIATLPPEYNLMTFGLARAWHLSHPAPMIIHSPQFHREFERFIESQDPVTERVGLRLGWKIRSWHAQQKLNGWRGSLQKVAWFARRVPGRLFRRLRQLAS